MNEGCDIEEHAAWPPLGVRIDTPRLTLRPVFGDLILEVARLGAEGVHDPGEMPFNVAWTDVEPPEQLHNTVRHYHLLWSTFGPDDWNLPLAVFEQDHLVGVQHLHGEGGYGTTRTASSGSWVSRTRQGRGIGKEMRAAVLHLLFVHLDGVRAESGYLDGNLASAAVSRSLGYRPNGTTVHTVRGRSVEEQRLVLTRDDWLPTRRDDIDVSGVTPALRSLVGLT